MKKIVKWLMVAMVMVVMAGCGASQSTSKLEQVQQKGKLILGTSADYPPFEWHKIQEGKDTIVGFDIEVARHLATQLGVELVVEDMNFDSLIAALKTGKVDLVMAGMTPTPERSKEVDFTKVYYTSQFVYVVNKSQAAQYKAITDFKGKQTGVQKGSLQETIAKGQLESNDIVSMAKNDALILALTTQKLDGVILDKLVADSYVKQYSELVVADVDIPQDSEGSAVAIQKGHADFLEAIQKGLDELESSGAFEQMMREHLDMMPQGQ